MDIREAYQSFLKEMQGEAAAHGRSAAEIKLIAVSKTQSPEKIRSLYALGQRDFGENYTQELITKAAALADLDIRWSYIGQLQSNKIRSIVQIASEIQAVASFRHAALIRDAARACGKNNFSIFLAVNAAGEGGKSGVSAEQVLALAQDIARELPELNIEGLMTVPPAEGDLMPLFKELRILARHIGHGRLSLGMSGDWRLALQAGTDILRIGTRLFGART